MTELQQRSLSSSDHFQDTNPGPAPMFSSDEPEQSLGERSEGSDDGSESAKSVDEVEETLSYLAKHGGVRNLNALLAAAVTPGSEIPDTRNIREWSFRDIKCMPLAQQKDWIEACCQELHSLQERKVYDLVNPLQGRRVIKNRWVFDLKTDGVMILGPHFSFSGPHLFPKTFLANQPPYQSPAIKSHGPKEYHISSWTATSPFKPIGYPKPHCSPNRGLYCSFPIVLYF